MMLGGFWIDFELGARNDCVQSTVDALSVALPRVPRRSIYKLTDKTQRKHQRTVKIQRLLTTTMYWSQGQLRPVSVTLMLSRTLRCYDNRWGYCCS